MRLVQVKVPFQEREIPIMADEYVDMEFGTGCLKVLSSSLLLSSLSSSLLLSRLKLSDTRLLLYYSQA